MSHDHLPKSKDSHVEGMPSIHETVKPEGPFQFDPALGVSAQQAEAARKSKRNKIVASVAGGAILLTGGAFVAGRSLGGGETQPQSNHSTSASLDPTPTSAETQTASPEVTIEAMDAMTSDEFITLPVESQVDWAVTEINKAWNVEGIYDNQTLATLLGRDSVNGASIDNYNPIYDPLDVNADAADVIGQQTYVEQLASFAGADLGRKINSALTFPGSPAHEYYYGTFGDTSMNPIGTKGPETRKPIDDKLDNNPYVASDGSEYPLRTITETNNGSTYVETYAFVPSKVLEQLSQKDGAGLWLLVSFESV